MSKVYSIICVFFLQFFILGAGQAALISLPITGTVLEINDPENFLSGNLGLSVSVGDSFVSGYSLDDSDTAFSVSLGGILHNIVGLSLNTFADFGAGGSVENLNNNYRVSVWDNDFGVDLWGISAAVGSGVDDLGENFLHILDIAFIDLSQSKHNSNNLYFNNTLLGWDFAGINITQYYSDLDPRNKTLLTSFPTLVPVPGALYLFATALVGFIACRRKIIHLRN